MSLKYVHSCIKRVTAYFLTYWKVSTRYTNYFSSRREFFIMYNLLCYHLEWCFIINFVILQRKTRIGESKGLILCAFYGPSLTGSLDSFNFLGLSESLYKFVFCKRYKILLINLFSIPFNPQTTNSIFRKSLKIVNTLCSC